MIIPEGKGRRPSDDVISYRTKVYSVITESKGEVLTAPDLADKLDIPTTEVRRALNWFLKQGIVEKVDGKKQTSLDGGRPATLWHVL